MGAFLGGFSGYLFASLQRREETKSRRSFLLKALRQELNSIGSKVQPYDVSKVIYRDPIRLRVPTQLLDGQTLEFRKDSKLIEALLHLQVALSKCNDMIEVTNLAQSIAPVPDSAHGQIYANIVERHELVIRARDEVLELIPSD